MGRDPGWGARATGRPPLWSPGRATRWTRGHKQLLWIQMSAVASSEDAAVAVGMAPAVGTRWFREAGGMPDVEFNEPSRRYLSFAEREEIALLKAKGMSVGAIARELSVALRRSPGSCAATPRRGAASWRTGPRSRSGTAIAARPVRSRRSLRTTSGCATTFRNGLLARSDVPMASRCPDLTSRRGRDGGGLGCPGFSGVGWLDSHAAGLPAWRASNSMGVSMPSAE